MSPYEAYRLVSLGAGNTPEEAESDGLYGAWLAGQATAGAADTQLAVGVRGTAARECSEAGAVPASAAPALPFEEASCPEQAAYTAGAGATPVTPAPAPTATPLIWRRGARIRPGAAGGGCGPANPSGGPGASQREVQVRNRDGEGGL